jgi:hypothetical protein
MAPWSFCSHFLLISSLKTCGAPDRSPAGNNEMGRKKMPRGGNLIDAAFPAPDNGSQSPCLARAVRTPPDGPCVFDQNMSATNKEPGDSPKLEKLVFPKNATAKEIAAIIPFPPLKNSRAPGTFCDALFPVFLAFSLDISPSPEKMGFWVFAHRQHRLPYPHHQSDPSGVGMWIARRHRPSSRDNAALTA